MITESGGISLNLVHALRRAPVREGKLNVRVDRAELEAMILVVAKLPQGGRQVEPKVAALLRYLEETEDRFEDPEDEAVAG
jgi:hypothetical protein